MSPARLSPGAAHGRRAQVPYRVTVPEGSQTSTQSAQRPRAVPKPPLRPGRLLSAAARVGLGDPWRILAVAITVSTLTVLVEIVAEHLAGPRSSWQQAVAGILAEGVALLGTVLVSGFLCRLTGAAGRPERVALGHVTRTLPWRKLVAADILVALATIATLLALIIPGLIMATLLAVVGPVIEIEDRTARAALRRSAHLVRPYFWRVALIATVPVLAVAELEAVGPEPWGVPGIFEILAIRGVAEGFLEAVIGLVLIQLSYRLIAVDAIRAQIRKAVTS
jgi:hypothetical protein